jgi:hypothetical protein
MSPSNYERYLAERVRLMELGATLHAHICCLGHEAPRRAPQFPNRELCRKNSVEDVGPNNLPRCVGIVRGVEQCPEDIESVRADHGELTQLASRQQNIWDPHGLTTGDLH